MTDYPRYHGSPFDRGSADAYYGRDKDPHKYVTPQARGDTFADFLAGPSPEGRVTLTDPAEIEAYLAGYDGETDRKDWGWGD